MLLHARVGGVYPWEDRNFIVLRCVFLAFSRKFSSLTVAGSRGQGQISSGSRFSVIDRYYSAIATWYVLAFSLQS